MRPRLAHQGRASGLDQLLDVATRLGEKYMGPHGAIEFGRRNAVAGELLATVRPLKVIGEKGVTA